MAGITPANLGSDFISIVSDAGTNIYVTYWSGTNFVYSGTDYDEQYLKAGSQTIFSGGALLFPLNEKSASFYQQYVKEGLLLTQDKVMFVAGSLEIPGNARIRVGHSTNGSEYDVLPPGAIPYEISGTVIYKKVLIRISTGSEVYVFA